MTDEIGLGVCMCCGTIGFINKEEQLCEDCYKKEFS